MPRGTPLPRATTQAIVNAHRNGMTYKQLAEAHGLPISTMRGVVYRWGRVGGLPPRARIYRRLICERLGNHIKNMVLRDHNLNLHRLPAILRDQQVQGVLGREYQIPGYDTIRRWLVRQGFVHRKLPRKPKINDRNKAKRVEFARKWLDGDIGELAFSDESCFYMNPDRDVFGWFPQNIPREDLPNNARVHSQGGKIMVWGVISRTGPGPLVVVDGMMDGPRYRNILREHLEDYWNRLGENREVEIKFMQDNAPCHRARDTRALISEITGNDPIEWPPYSPDLNPIENVWGWMKRQMMTMPPADTLVQLTGRIEALWAEVTPEFCASLFESMDRRARAVIARNGRPINY